MNNDCHQVKIPRLEWWPAPPAPETPEEYDRVGLRRFRLPGRDAPAAVLVLSPGFTGGINDLDYLAAEVTAACGGRLQVWTTERRNHLLEDLRGVERAEAAGDPRRVLSYYLEGGPAGFVPPAQETAAFMRHWGLATALADLRAVALRARAAVGPAGKVLLGGHSLGGMLAQCYAAWEFPDGPGHQEIDGLVLIDGAVGNPDWARTTGMAQYQDDMEAIRRGEYYWEDPGKGAAPRFGILAQAAAMAASLPEWREQPSMVAPLVPELLRLPPDVTVTNEAALGLVIDAGTGPIDSFLAHVGRLDAHGPQPLRWLGFRETGELTDLQRVAAALRTHDGANGSEWYASRLLNAEVDLSSNLDSRDPDTGCLARQHGLRLWHHGEEAIPVFAVVTGSRGQKRERYEWYAATVATEQVTLLDAPEMEHLDSLFAENDGRNRCLPALVEWLLWRL
jgi:pimeloyl-ACP methyl ester carboxylesterase